jgi:hypothetical protein
MGLESLPTVSHTGVTIASAAKPGAAGRHIRGGADGDGDVCESGYADTGGWIFARTAPTTNALPW